VVDDVVVGGSDGVGSEVPGVGPGQLVCAEPGDAGHGVDPVVAAVGHDGSEESLPVVCGPRGGVVGVGELVEEPAPAVNLDEQVDQVNPG